jgi:hypothetical protein
VPTRTEFLAGTGTRIRKGQEEDNVAIGLIALRARRQLLLEKVAPQAGLEPAALRLTGENLNDDRCCWRVTDVTILLTFTPDSSRPYQSSNAHQKRPKSSGYVTIRVTVTHAGGEAAVYVLRVSPAKPLPEVLETLVANPVIVIPRRPAFVQRIRNAPVRELPHAELAVVVVPTGACFTPDPPHKRLSPQMFLTVQPPIRVRHRRSGYAVSHFTAGDGDHGCHAH